MRYRRYSQIKRNSIYNNGTLVEVIVTLAILLIILSISIPAYLGYAEYAKESVCLANRQKLIEMYHIYLINENLEHADILFERYIQENAQNICPSNGAISVVNGKIRCSMHKDVQEDDVEDEPEVPYL